MTMLEVNELSKQYQRGGNVFNAVDRVSLSIEAGAFVSIIGRSGSGKSTLLNMLTGLLKPTSGSIFFDGVDLGKLPDDDLSRLRNDRIGYVPQGVSALSNFTVLDNVRLPFFLHKREGDASGRAVFLLDEVGLLHLAGMYPAQLSGGELRRVFIARALMNAPDILIADEPTADLDPASSDEILQLFSRINHNGTTVLIVTHALDALGFGDRVLKMDAGKLAVAQKMAINRIPNYNQ